MREILIQQKCVKALNGDARMPAHLTPVEKTEMNDKAISVIILYLGDKVLREVARETIVVSMWTKLELLYLTKSLAHRQFLKQQLYSFRMVESKSIMENLAEFNKIINDLVNIEVNLKDEDKALLLLCVLLRSFENFKDTMLYGK
ncbi:cytochrome P450 [Trifolium medium]|uniref:Cytochrome P450 n=1 Tax=Trifolium medium TaxID=97028 RepID=A0A392M5B6_9FABA|nr:cytochrome P450 [Trifolium medium]